jgi:Tfp pilus assembly protein PilO
MTKKQLTYIIASVILVVILGLSFVFAYLPLSKSVQAKRAELTEKQNQLNYVKKKVQQLDKLRKDIEQIQAETRILQDKVPNQTDVPGIITLMEKLADENGIIVSNVTFDGDQSSTTGTMNSPVTEININTCTIKLVGKYLSYISYFKSLRESPRLFGIKNIKFAPNADDGRDITTEINLAYFNYTNPASNSTQATPESKETGSSPTTKSP